VEIPRLRAALGPQDAQWACLELMVSWFHGFMGSMGSMGLRRSVRQSLGSV
jgi:hypothetical protein